MVGVLCQEAVHEQKSVSSWTVNDVSILHLQDGGVGLERGGICFCVAKMILYSLSLRICLNLSGC